jgi:hypothetical protein
MGSVKFREVESADVLLSIFHDLGVKRVVVKRLSSNDNSKNQLYLGSGFEAAQIIPHGEIYPDKTRSKRIEPKFKAAMNFSWVDAKGKLELAPAAQIIFYPKYPEVRFSGFLSGCGFNLTNLMGVRARIEGRLLFWGITDTDSIVGHVLSPCNPSVREFKEMLNISEEGALITFSLSTPKESSKDKLLRKLKIIHQKKWIRGSRLTSDRNRIDYFSSNAGGYTLEAEFGIAPNGYSEPDFEIWELKQYGVTSFDRVQSKPITLMTPEPTGGIYTEEGLKRFIQIYGYQDRRGRENRINFGGVHRIGAIQRLTQLEMKLIGYDSETKKITDSEGSIVLVDKSDVIAASWDFSSLLKHWNRKHQHAVYIPSMNKKENDISFYAYSNNVQLGEHTDFLLFLESLNDGSIYYDPAIKLEGIGTGHERHKRRSQFRIGTVKLHNLYKTFELIDVLDT